MLLLVFAPTRVGELHRARGRRLAERGQDPHALRDRADHRRGDLRARRGAADLRGHQVPPQARRPRAGAGARQHAARGGLDDRRRADRRRRWPPSRSSFLPSIKNPPNSNANGLQQFAGLEFASLNQPKPPNGKAPAHQRGRPAVPLALRLHRRQAAHREPAGVRLLLDGRAHQHHCDPPDQLGRRDPLLVDPEARRQGRRHPGPQQLHLVQDLEARLLPRAVRRAVRRQPRRHARAGARGDAGPVPGLAEPSAAARSSQAQKALVAPRARPGKALRTRGARSERDDT